MNLCKYCKDKNMTKEEYKTLQNNIKLVATNIKAQLTYRNGVYYPTSDILHYQDSDMKVFIIQELKKLGIEFRENNTLYRVTD